MIKKRAFAFIFDYCFIVLMFIIFFEYFGLHENVKLSNEKLLIIYTALLLFKDITGRSIGKLIFGIRIINSNYIKNILRNVTLFFYPVEVIVLLIFKKRIMDYILKTDVIEVGKKTNSEK